MKALNNIRQKDLLLLLLMAAGFGLSSCTKQSGYEFVEGDYYFTGTFHYFKNPVKIQKWPFSNVTMLDVNAYIVKDDLSGTYFDTMLITKSSVPYNYRNDGEKHVAVSIARTISGTTTEARHDFYRLLCIEEIK